MSEWNEAIGKSIAFVFAALLVSPWVMFLFADTDSDGNLFSWKHTFNILRVLVVGTVVFAVVGSALVYGVAGLIMLFGGGS